MEELDTERKEEWISLIKEGLEQGLTEDEAIAKAKTTIYLKPQNVQLRAFVEAIKTSPPN